MRFDELFPLFRGLLQKVPKTIAVIFGFTFLWNSFNLTMVKNHSIFKNK